MSFPAGPQAPGRPPEGPRHAEHTGGYVETDLQPAPTYDDRGVASQIVGEYVKSFGFRRDADGELQWSFENIRDAFQEDPFFTTVDWLVTLPIFAWGKAVVTVVRGTGAAGRAYKAGAVGLRQAARIERTLAPRGRLSRYIASPITRRYDDRTLKFLDRWRNVNGDLDPSDAMAISNQLRRDETARIAVLQQRNDTFQKQLRARRFTKDQEAEFHRLMGLRREEALDDFARFEADLARDQREFFEATRAMRDYMHDEAFSSYLISPEVHALRKGAWWQQDTLERTRAALSGTRRASRLSPKRGERHFLARMREGIPEGGTPIEDVSYGIAEMFQAGAAIERQKTILSLGSSILAKTPEEIIAAYGSEAAARSAGWLDEGLKIGNLLNRGPGEARLPASVQKLIGRQDEIHRQYTKAQRAMDRLAGKASGRWEMTRRRKDLVRLQRDMEKIDGQVRSALDRHKRHNFLRPVPDEIANKYLDPHVAEDVKGFLQWHEREGSPWARMYYGLQAFFKKTHVPYNPATIMRNLMGGIIFHSFATGMKGGPVLFPGRGVAALKGLGRYQGQLQRATERGLLAFDPDREIMELVDLAAGNTEEIRGIPAAIGRLLGSDRLTRYMARGDEAVRRLYSGIDDGWKMESYISLEKRHYRNFLRQGLDKGEALSRAADQAVLDVARFHPHYGAGSKFMQQIRPHVPFISFPIEAARVWKNAFIFRPHMALMWTHSAEIGTEVAAGAMGLRPEEIQSAKESLPWYAQGKKMLMLPWRDKENKLHFLDLSYIIPMADFGSEAQMAENRLFGVAPIGVATLGDPTSNPLLNIVAAGATGEDPFSGRPIEPRFSEDYLGLRTEDPGTRKFIGLAEHVAGLLLPPAIPPGYVGINMIEMLTGRKSGVTGEELEAEAGRTIAANLAGLRTYEPTVKAQLSNIRREQRLAGDELTHAWDRWEAAMANGDFTAAEREREWIIEQRNRLGRGDGTSYFFENFKRHVPGRYGNVSRRDIRNVILRSSRFGASPEELGPVYMRWLELQRRR